MRIASHIAFAYGLLVLVSALWRIVPLEVLSPSLPLVFATYLGTGSRDRVQTVVFGSIAIGYLGDLLSGSPRGLGAFVCGVVCLGGHLMSRRLMVRGRVFVAVYVFVFALGGALLTVGARAYLGAALEGFWRELTLAAGTALLTGVAAPPVYRFCRRIDAAFARTERDREAILEGYLG